MKLNKSLGQNFFINEHLSQKIIDIILEDNPKNIVEIGAGGGFFTEKLCKKVPNIICIEKDSYFAKRLRNINKSLIVYNEDFLNFDMSKLPKDILFFGSLPYNTSKLIIRKIITSQYFTRPSYFIIQKEVADKYTAKEPNNNFLSISSQLYATPQKLFNIASGSFRPRPKVQGTFVQFNPKQDVFIPENFENFLKCAFRFPRKTLKNNLKINSSDPIFQKRPSELNLNEYLILFNQYLL